MFDVLTILTKGLCSPMRSMERIPQFFKGRKPSLKSPDGRSRASQAHSSEERWWSMEESSMLTDALLPPIPHHGQTDGRGAGT